MSDTSVTVIDTSGAALAPQTPAQKLTAYVKANRVFFLMALAGLLILATANPSFAAAEPANGAPPAELGQWITDGLFQGMGIVWGLAAIVTVLMIPAGLNFAMGIIKGIIGMFSNFKF